MSKVIIIILLVCFLVLEIIYLKSKKVKAFGGVVKPINKMNKEQVAQIAHEVNAAYCRSIGDNTQTSWADAPEWQKKSAVNGVQFHLDNPDASPSASHDSWLEEKKADGWKYGKEKNAETKEHPCFLPYDKLPVEQRSKDYLFKQVVESLKSFIPEVSE